jgi:hypothetical protein
MGWEGVERKQKARKMGAITVERRSKKERRKTKMRKGESHS